MVKKKIVVCTTLRDFNGTKNDKIQKLFLKSIEDQKYKNFELVVTLFGEKNVEKEINKYSFVSKFYAKKAENCRYSLTLVLLNAVNELKEDNGIILWTTCDIVFQEDFFEKIVLHTLPNTIGTSHPHITYINNGHFERLKQYGRQRLYSGFDLVFFDGAIFKEKPILDILSKYVFKDWGVFEHFLIALNEVLNDVNLVNLYEISKIKKIENDRKITNESGRFFVESHAKNSAVFDEFLYDYSISNKYYDLAYCHFKFKIIGCAIKHYLRFYMDIAGYLKRQTMSIAARVFSVMIEKLLKGER
ncbi:MAG: hypothetical protein LWW97_00070 [Deltaproteobacteria bacterium]|nr:hypothetical protein [Deltaproteobacteria bacterium]